MIIFPKTPITDDSFKKWGAIKCEETDEDTGDSFHYYIIPLPNTWDDDASTRPSLVSTASDEYAHMGMKKGEFKISVYDFGQLPLLDTEQDVELFYEVVTKTPLTNPNK